MSGAPERSDRARECETENEAVLRALAADPQLQDQLLESLEEFKQGKPPLKFADVQAEARRRRGGTTI